MLPDCLLHLSPSQSKSRQRSWWRRPLEIALWPHNAHVEPTGSHLWSHSQAQNKFGDLAVEVGRFGASDGSGIVSKTHGAACGVESFTCTDLDEPGGIVCYPMKLIQAEVLRFATFRINMVHLKQHHIWITACSVAMRKKWKTKMKRQL
ncbi:uncharacterized protein [Lolium perenne]|uniref:uncharacterized protein n=1 Tax=Lolium perenne TaxID=4522 RepID=UPI0021F4FFD9|nr:uncharacterized protein LOC127301638 [Lolium perenne]XP_051187867.1 uncharacterized protein LOC127301638 [Lolium perenne]XP_051187868.1 uncharacterized protein LOC127301638 [Lolium perenne]XP_051187869.1 uncharacterized protein LOC127301638 [Lolium perenne]XP_051187870.1 uncharacterized protein LOC127301638 [Lolium perenne]